MDRAEQWFCFLEEGNHAWLLRDWIVLTLNRLWEGGMFLETANLILEVLVTLTRTDIEEDDYDPYDGVDRRRGARDPVVGAIGLGLAGCVPMPLDLWKRRVLLALEWALQALPARGGVK